jgi:hypothetical protein
MEACAQVGIGVNRVVMVRRWNNVLSAGRVVVAMVWVDVVRGWGFWIVGDRTIDVIHAGNVAVLAGKGPTVVDFFHTL